MLLCGPCYALLVQNQTLMKYADKKRSNSILESVHVFPVMLRSSDLKLNRLAALKCNIVSQAKIN